LEERIKAAADGLQARFLRGMGGESMDFSSAAIEMSLWNHPFVLLTVAMWAVSRGSAAVAGELERGTMDMILSRPVPRPAFLFAHVVSAAFGLLLLGFALTIGNVIATRYIPLDSPPGFLLVVKPALNLSALGLTVYGYTLAVSSLCSARWIPSLIGSVVTMTSYVLTVLANLPGMDEWKFLEKVSIFKAFNPVEIVTEGNTFGVNTALLSALGTAGILFSFAAFTRRDLPAGS
jgi:ABC-2 type transport system permease protein